METSLRDGRIAPAVRHRRVGSVPGPSDGVAVWLLVTGATKPDNVAGFVEDLAEPDFALKTCEESGRVVGDGGKGYRAHWYCQFVREARDSFADVRLLKRLVGAGFRIVRFDGTMHH